MNIAMDYFSSSLGYSIIGFVTGYLVGRFELYLKAWLTIKFRGKKK